MAEARKQPPAWWRQAVVATLSVIAAYHALIQFGLSDAFASGRPDPFRVMDMVAKVKRAEGGIPLTERVGYFSDVPFSVPAGQAAFFAAQYAFAPRIVVREDAKTAAQARYWLAVFSRQRDFIRAGVERGLRFEQDLGGNVVLYRREGLPK